MGEPIVTANKSTLIFSGSCTLEYIFSMVRTKLCSANCTFIIFCFLQSAPVCNSSFMFFDLDTEEAMTIEGVIIGNNISFNSEQLMLNRHYNITITASNGNGTNTFQTEISK